MAASSTPPRRIQAPVHWTSRIAGVVLVLVGAANAAFGAWGLVRTASGMGPATAGGLLVAGLATLAAGVLVWRGGRLAALIALTFFGLLLVVQFGDVAARPTDPVALGRVAVLVVVCATLLGAMLRSRRTRVTTGTGSRR